MSAAGVPPMLTVATKEIVDTIRSGPLTAGGDTPPPVSSTRRVN